MIGSIFGKKFTIKSNFFLLKLRSNIKYLDPLRSDIACGIVDYGHGGVLYSFLRLLKEEDYSAAGVFLRPFQLPPLHCMIDRSCFIG